MTKLFTGRQTLKLHTDIKRLNVALCEPFYMAFKNNTVCLQLLKNGKYDLSDIHSFTVCSGHSLFSPLRI